MCCFGLMFVICMNMKSYRNGDNVRAATAHRDGTENLLAYVYARTGSAEFMEVLPSFMECVNDGLLSPNDAVLPGSLFPGS